jgi:thiol-disulfide isomerase/thioredoxin
VHGRIRALTRRALAVGFAFLAALQGGCSDRPDTNASAEPALVPITHAAWEERLKSYRPDIVVVDFWATWCAPCVERFPKMVEMAERYRSRGVRFVGVCMEDREDRVAVAGAGRFLVEKRATFDNFLLDEPLLEGFGKVGLLGIPAVLVYGRDGNLSARLTGDDPNRQFDENDIEAAIERLLAQPR